jgi:DNA-binding NarL/FixJ family response regulator
MTTVIRVLLAEDHALVRAGFRALLQGIPDILVVAEAGDGEEALRLVAETQPNVVLMDITMPRLNGLEATARLKKEFPQVHVIILSMHSMVEYVIQALRAGAVGYLLKDSGSAELEAAIRAAARGDAYLSQGVVKPVVVDISQRAEGELDSLQRLTPRQRQILQLIAEGHTTKEIAQMLNVKTKTVEVHRAQLMQRLDIHDVAGLVRYAIRMGLVSPEQ